MLLQFIRSVQKTVLRFHGLIKFNDPADGTLY